MSMFKGQFKKRMYVGSMIKKDHGIDLIPPFIDYIRLLTSFLNSFHFLLQYMGLRNHC